MSRKYTAYLLRWWHFANGEERLEVRHIHDDTRHRFRSLAEATAWLASQPPDQPRGSTTPPHEATHPPNREPEW